MIQIYIDSAQVYTIRTWYWRVFRTSISIYLSIHLFLDNLAFRKDFTRFIFRPIIASYILMLVFSWLCVVTSIVIRDM